MIESDICNDCGNPSNTFFSDGKGNAESLCQYCHNEAMVGLLDSIIVDDKLVGKIRCGGTPDESVIFFGENACTWEALGRYASTYEGMNIKIEFGE